MRQIWIPRHGDPSVLEVREAPDPEPGPGQVRIQVEATGVNFADLMARIGIYPDAPPLPLVVGYEVGGRIDRVGAGADPALVGKDVLAAVQFGGYSTAVVVDADAFAVRPEGMDAPTGASLVVTGLTAWFMLEEIGRVRAGDRVLVHSASGGVGLMALDLIKRRGGIAVGTASGSKHDWLKARGYDELVDYRTTDFHAALKDGPGFDLILDPVGGDSWAKGLDLLRTGGRLIVFGASSASTGNRRSLWAAAKMAWQVPWRKTNPFALMDGNKGVIGVNLGHMWGEKARLRGWLEQIVGLWAKGEVRTHIHAKVPFDNPAEAHRMLHDRQNVGKVVLVA